MDAIDLLESPTNEPDYYTAEDYEDSLRVSYQRRYATYLLVRARNYPWRPKLTPERFVELSKESERLDDDYRRELTVLKERNSPLWDAAYNRWMQQSAFYEWALCA